MNSDKLNQLRIASRDKSRPKQSFWLILLGVALLSGAGVYFGVIRMEQPRLAGVTNQTLVVNSAKNPGTNSSARATNDAVLTVSGYIINRERIALSPRFLGVVKWIGVKKGDAVTNGQVVVLLDDAEYRARLRETEGRLGAVKVAVEKAALDYQRARELVAGKVEMRKIEDDARLQLESAKAGVKEIEGQIDLIRTYIDWTIIRSPIQGVVLEKLVNPNELVVPQSFGGTRGPSTALIAVADPKDLQVEIDLNETDVGKVFLNQKCRVSPEAYPEKNYEGYVAEMAPEANRQKGTLQIKVQIRDPDKFLTPELSAKVDFLRR
jgi:HlyD family secretion protein